MYVLLHGLADVTYIVYFSAFDTVALLIPNINNEIPAFVKFKYYWQMKIFLFSKLLEINIKNITTINNKRLMFSVN